MYISKKRVITVSSMLIALLIFAFLATPCYNYTGSLGLQGYYSAFDFGFGGNIVVESFTSTLVSIVGAIFLFNLVSYFVEKINEKTAAIVNICAYVLALVFSICCLCTKFINTAYNPTNSLIFVLVLTLISFVTSIAPLLAIDDK